MDIPGDVAGPGAALQRNVSTAESLLGREGADLRSRFGSFPVHVHVPRGGGTDRDTTAACHTVLNLLARMASVRYSGPDDVLSTLPPQLRSRIAISGSAEAAGHGERVSILFGPSRADGAPHPLYVGSSGWSAYLSTRAPCRWPRVATNAMGAMLAGALAAGEVFKMMFPEAEPEMAVHLEYDLVTHGSAPQPVTSPGIPDLVDLGRMAIIGCGAIGQAMCLALREARLAGDVVLIDKERIDESNEQRYMLAYDGLRGHSKAKVLMDLLTPSNPLLRISAAHMTYENYVTEYNHGFSPQTAVVCVDNVETRINVQGSLPRVVWNGWTDVSPGSLRYGASRHTLGKGACIACGYYPDGEQPTETEMNSIMTGLPEEEVRGLLSGGKACTEEIVRRVAASRGIPVDRLMPNVGRPFGELLHGNCGVFAMGGGGAADPAPAPHQPALAGVLLASQIVLSRIARKCPGIRADLVRSASDFDAMRLPKRGCLFRIQRDKRCFCGDADYVEAYKKKWRRESKGAGKAAKPIAE